MYGQYRNSGIRPIHTYEQALERYNNTQPIRGSGRNAGVRPLGHRNRPWFYIRLNTNGDITCGMHNVDVITFTKENYMFIHDTYYYASQTTANFITDVLRGKASASVYDRSVILYYHRGSYRVGKQGVILRPSEGGEGEVIVAPTEKTYRINRKKMNELRRKTDAFRTYVIGTTKLRSGLFELDELGGKPEAEWRMDMRRWDKIPQEILSSFMEAAVTEEDNGNWHKASLQLAFSGWFWRDQVRLDIGGMLGNLDSILMAANPDVFDVVELPEGQVKRNRYGKYAKYKEEV